MSVWQAGLLGAWALLVVNLALTLRVVRRLRAEQEHTEQLLALHEAPDLEVGAPAPDFRARTLAGRAIGLDDFRGRPVTFLFVSPECPRCRRELRGLVRLARVARDKAGVEFVLVSDFGIPATDAWLERMRTDQQIEVDLRVVVAPTAASGLWPAYNPRIVTPFHVFVREDVDLLRRSPA